MHYLTYGNFYQVYACWRSLFCIQEDVRIPLQGNYDQKRVIQFLALGRKRKKKTSKLLLVLKSQLL